MWKRKKKKISFMLFNIFTSTYDDKWWRSIFAQMNFLNGIAMLLKSYSEAICPFTNTQLESLPKNRESETEWMGSAWINQVSLILLQFFFLHVDLHEWVGMKRNEMIPSNEYIKCMLKKYDDNLRRNFMH